MTQIERTILANQFEILKRLDLDNAEIYDKKIRILKSGIESCYDEVILDDHTYSKELYTETVSILNMYRKIDNGVAKLKENGVDLSDLDLGRIEFVGFDASYHEHLFVAEYLINEKDKFDERAGRDLNSRDPTCLDRYKKMLSVYKKYEDQYIDYTKTHLQEFVNALMK